MKTSTLIASLMMVAQVAVAGVSSTPENRIGSYPDVDKIQGEEWLGVVPDTDLTPGAIDPCMHAKDICEGTTKDNRHTTDKTKKQVLQAYQLKYGELFDKVDGQDSAHAAIGANGKPEGVHEIDHLISLEIGGADDASNLWPEPFQSVIAGAVDKDVIEHSTKFEMCAILKNQGEVAADEFLALMQRAIAGGFTSQSGRFMSPKVSWYHLYILSAFSHTDHHGKMLPHSPISYSAQLQSLKSILKDAKVNEVPSDNNCIAPKIQ